MRASWRVSPPASVAVTSTTLRPGRNGSVALSGTSFGRFAASSALRTSAPFSVSVTCRTPLSAVTVPVNGSIALSARASGPSPAIMMASGAGRSTSSSTAWKAGLPRPPKSRSTSILT